MLSKIIYVIGVAGSGKTTVGRAIAEALGVDYFDADDFHPVENVSKMQRSIPLNDEDRKPWLNALHDKALSMREKGAVITCSALKESYRQRLMQDMSHDEISWVVLQGDFDTIYERMSARLGHFMPTGLLQSQFETWENPSYGIHVDISQSVEEIIKEVINFEKV